MIKAAAKRPRGRPPIKEGQFTYPTTIRLTEDQYRKFIEMGGADWVRALIDKRLPMSAELVKKVKDEE
jgi:hypothetical protein